MQKRLISLLLFLPLGLFSLEVTPWFGDVYEFTFTSKYAYSRFSRVADATTSLSSPSNDHLLYFDLELPFTPQWCIDLDLQFAASPRRSFRFRTTALQLRYLWLDDIVGDWASLYTGGNIRYVPQDMLEDISTPYQGNACFNLNIAIGKEVDYLDIWRFNFWAYGDVGIANKGSPWIEGILGFDTDYDERHGIGFRLIGYHGYGSKKTLTIDDFNGYGKERTKFIDLDVYYALQLGVWGKLRFDYTRRFAAEVCPAEVNTFALRYVLQFSF